MIIEKSILKSISFFAAKKNDLRYYLQGIHVYQDGENVRLEASNGHYVATATIYDSIDFDVIIPNETLDLALQMKCDFISLEIDNINGIPYTSIEGRFPDCKQAYSPKYATPGTCIVQPEYYALIGKVQKILKAEFTVCHRTDILYFTVGAVRGAIVCIRGRITETPSDY